MNENSNAPAPVITPIPEGVAPAWSLFINGEPATGVCHIRLSNPRYGVWEYGFRDGKFDAWAFAEAKGGGSCTIPWFRDADGQLYIGLILEDRPNMGGKRWCVIGGFVELGETHEQAQVREAKEETETDLPEAKRCSGLPVNSNRFFFVADPLQDLGVHLFMVELKPEMVELDVMTGQMRLKGDVQRYVAKGNSPNLVFFPWRIAARICADSFLHASVLADLL